MYIKAKNFTNIDAECPRYHIEMFTDSLFNRWGKEAPINGLVKVLDPLRKSVGSR